MISSSYEYSPYIWPMLIGIGLTVIVGIYSWCHRTVPGAKGLAFMMFFWSLKLTASTLGLISLDFPTKVFWFQIERFSLLPATAAGLAFALGYAGLDTWLNRHTLALIAIPALLLIPLTLTNESHYLIWTDMWLDGRIRYKAGILAYPLWAYGLLLGVGTISTFIWLFIRSPLHRWPVGLILLGMFTSRTLFYLTEAGLNPVRSIDLFDIGAMFICPVYFVALFQFRLFDILPVARNRAIEQMRDGMLVIDAQGRIADLNRAAQELLFIRSNVIGRDAAQVLVPHPKLLEIIHKPSGAQDEICLNDSRYYRIHISPLATRRGYSLGNLILFYDMSEERKAQKVIQEHQRKLTMLKEREVLARELHDGIGQNLAAAHLHAESAREFLSRGETELAKSCLGRVTDLTQGAKEAIGIYLHGVKIGYNGEQSLISKLRQYLQEYSQDYQISSDLIVAPELEGKSIDAEIEAQLQPIIHEALTNVRRHGEAGSVRVTLAPFNGEVRVTIEDDGRGFDPEGITVKQGFGLRSMRGRTESLGGVFEIRSAPGKGTQLIVRCPMAKRNL